MKYTIPAAAICDHCGKTAPGDLMVMSAQDLEMKNLVLPEGWIAEDVAPAIAPIPGRRVQIDLSKSPAEIASVSGRVVRALWCGQECQDLAAGKETFRSLLVTQ